MIGCHIDISDRKQTEEQLRESKEELERFFSVSLDLLCIADMEGHFCRLNRSWESTLGYDLAELEGRKFLDFVHPEDIAVTLESMSALSNQEAVIAFVNRYRCKDGTYRYIEWYSRPYGNSIYAAARDITNRKYAEEEILEKQRFIQKIADASPNILYLYDLQEHRNVYCNREVSAVLGYTAAEIQAMGSDLFTNLMHPDDLPRIYGYYQKINASQDGDIFELEYRMRHINGEYRWLYSRDSIFSRDEQGHPKQTIGTAQDISDRKQSESALRNLSDRLTLAVKSAAIGIWDWDVIQNVLQWDDRMYELYGIKPEQFANAYDAWASTLHPDDRINTENAIQQALRGEKEYDPEFRVVLPDGNSRFIKAYSLVQRNAQGEPLRMVGINFDISDRRRTEALIQQTTAQLEASNRELEAFAYSVSHDLRAPLRAIDGFSNALMEDYGDKFDEDGRDYFERIRRNIQRMGLLIDDLLRLSRVSRSEMQYSQVNLSSLVEEQIHELQESDPQRQVEAIIAPEIIVSADITLMRVIINNLIQNAWKFTSNHATARIEFGLIKQDEQSVYFVRDDGAGFDMNYTKMLFGVFQRLHNANEFHGTGIGLATVQRVIHRHGGKVWAEGEVEKGATFYFTLPNNPTRIDILQN
ncbi:MAG: PAS domain-containing protein, partial [Pseudanabaena sp.]|jgi:PAS domain S-box-containing protein